REPGVALVARIALFAFEDPQEAGPFRGLPRRLVGAWRRLWGGGGGSGFAAKPEGATQPAAESPDRTSLLVRIGMLHLTRRVHGRIGYRVGDVRRRLGALSGHRRERRLTRLADRIARGFREPGDFLLKRALDRIRTRGRGIRRWCSGLG